MWGTKGETVCGSVKTWFGEPCMSKDCVVPQRHRRVGREAMQRIANPTGVARKIQAFHDCIATLASVKNARTNPERTVNPSNAPQRGGA